MAVEGSESRGGKHTHYFYKNGPLSLDNDTTLAQSLPLLQAVQISITLSLKHTPCNWAKHSHSLFNRMFYISISKSSQIITKKKKKKSAKVRYHWSRELEAGLMGIWTSIIFPGEAFVLGEGSSNDSLQTKASLLLFVFNIVLECCHHLLLFTV